MFVWDKIDHHLAETIVFRITMVIILLFVAYLILDSKFIKEKMKSHQGKKY